MEHRWWVKNYDHDVRPTLTFPRFPAHEILRISANAEPDKAAIDFYGSRITYWELQIQVIRLANAMIASGVKKGDRIGLLLANSPQFVISFWALLHTGAIAVNLNPMYTKDELKAIVEKLGITGFITYDMVLPTVKSLSKEIDSLSFILVTKLSDYIDNNQVSTSQSLELELGWHHFSELIAACDNEAAPALPIKQEDPAVIQFTGGTTGTPKGAVLTHRNVVCSTYTYNEWLNPIISMYPVPRRNFMGVLPYFHVYGEICANCFSVVCRATQVILSSFNVDEVLDTVARIGDIPYFPAVPTMITALVNHPRAKELGKIVGIMNSGGAPLPAALIRKANDQNIFIVEGWGMSEITSLGINNPYMGVKKPLSIGLPLVDTDVKIVDPDTGLEVPQGQTGEIHIKSNLIMKGYWNEPEETARMIDKDGFLNTGDVAYQDEEGYIFIVDRTKDLIISGGYNIYPREIDEAILQHPKVKDIITIGIPDDYRGEVPKVFIVLGEGMTATPEEIIDYCKEIMAPYKVPRFVEFRSELPRSAVGKALRRVLRDEEMAKKI
ncbi:MAG: long-chain fatty acid--CoA ligase [Syntrophomonadaceae bacterium]|nr:long-chain fatty acid--CoA ligase [Syntrophomonadaceae bacterium]